MWTCQWLSETLTANILSWRLSWVNTGSVCQKYYLKETSPLLWCHAFHPRDGNSTHVNFKHGCTALKMSSVQTICPLGCQRIWIRKDNANWMYHRQQLHFLKNIFVEADKYCINIFFKKWDWYLNSDQISLKGLSKNIWSGLKSPFWQPVTISVWNAAKIIVRDKRISSLLAALERN